MSFLSSSSVNYRICWSNKTRFDSARVIRSSSLDASPKFYDSENGQLTKTEHSYESSKYQI